MSQRNNPQRYVLDGRRNTIGLTPHALDTLLDRLDSLSDESKSSDARTHSRLSIREAFVEVCVCECGNSERRMLMATRNISDGGIAVLHSSYLYPGNACTVTLRSPDVNGAYSVLPGRIVRCTHREGMIHEVGISFQSPIDASRYAATGSKRKKTPTKAMGAATLQGRVLQIDASPVDRRLIEYFLSDTKVELINVGSFKKARDSLKNPVDLILTEMLLSDGAVEDFVRWARAENITTPIVLHTATTGSQVQQHMHGLEIQGLMTKPVEREALISQLFAFLRSDSQGGADQESETTCSPAVSKESIVKLFKDELDTIVVSIETALAKDDAMEIYTIATRLGGTALTLGLAQLSDDSRLAAKCVASSMSCEESAEEIRTLVDSCKAAKGA